MSRRHLPKPWFETPDGRCRRYVGDRLDLLPRALDTTADLVLAALARGRVASLVGQANRS